MAIGFGTDLGFYKALGSSTTRVAVIPMFLYSTPIHSHTKSSPQNTIASIVSDSNFAYYNQVGVFLRVGRSVVNTASGGPNWNRDVTAGNCMAIDTLLPDFRSWYSSSGTFSPSQEGVWHLLTACYPTGTVGLAYLGVLCGSSGTGVSSLAGSFFTFFFFFLK
jgi:hypothetical protein